jgi:hypothetical protein
LTFIFVVPLWHDERNGADQTNVGRVRAALCAL